MLTEQEIDAAERLRARGEFAAALALTKEMLACVEDRDTKMRLLFDVLYCSTQLCFDDVTNRAIAELEQMPEPRESRVFIDFIKAMTYIAHGHTQKGLDLIEANLKSEFMARDDFREWKYKHLAYKGQALTWLGRCQEALMVLDEAHLMNPEGVRQTAILIDQANCFLALDRYEDSFNAAQQVLMRGDEEMSTLAMLYMAECRMWQGRASDALGIYVDIRRRLPCRLVAEDRVQRGMDGAVAHLEKRSHQDKPF
jgi:tetratricopeptide (TPR) repeat protein